MEENQDDLIYKNNRELFYSFDPEKKAYVKQVNYQYQANQVIIKQGWDALEERVREFEGKVIRGELSPLVYYMEKHQMEVPILADYCNFRKRKVRKHLTPKGFTKISEADLQVYAEVFDITVEKLISPDFNQS